MATNTKRAEVRGKAQGGSSKKNNAEFAAAVLAARKDAELSQMELARLGGVSPKTIVQVEETGRARSDAVIRLSVALGKGPEDWLKLAGHSVLQSRIKEIVEQGGLERNRQPFARIDPLKYFEEMVGRVEKHGSALMCSCVMSNIRFNRTDLWGVTERLFKAGLHLALVCPFSVTVNEIIVRKGGLNRYYNRSYGWACDLARDLQENLPVARNRVHVFMPAQGTLVYTPIRLDEMRPALTKFSEVPGDSGKDRVPARYELGSYVKFGDGKPDRWVEIYNGEGEPAERVAEDYFAWFDFFSDIFNNWTPTPDGSQYDTSKLGFWQLADRT